MEFEKGRVLVARELTKERSQKRLNHNGELKEFKKDEGKTKSKKEGVLVSHNHFANEFEPLSKFEAPIATCNDDVNTIETTCTQYLF